MSTAKKASQSASSGGFTRKQWAAAVGVPLAMASVPALGYYYGLYNKERRAANDGANVGPHGSKSFLRFLLLRSPFSDIAGTGVYGALESYPPGRDWSGGPPVRRTPLYIAGGSEGAVARHGHLPRLSNPAREIGADLHTVLANQERDRVREPRFRKYLRRARLFAAVALQLGRIVFYSVPVVILFVLAAKAPHRVEMKTACEALQRLLITLGPTYVKLGQWMGTRHDLFPTEICHYLSVLCDKAPTHPWEHTERELLAQKVITRQRVKVPKQQSIVYNRPASATAGTPHAPPPSTAVTATTADDGFEEVEVEVKETLVDYLESVERLPINSGSVAQVHYAVLKKPIDGVPAGTRLALKVLHPNTREKIWVDVWVLRLLARGLELCYAGCRFADPMVHWYEFSSLLLSQLNFEREADNMDRFQYNFRNIPQIVFPTALRSLTNADVLVETFEIGWKMEDVVVTKKMADLGVRMFLKMIFEDNFLHADLHTGNLLLRRRNVTDGTFTNDLTEGSDSTHVNEIVVLDPGLVTTLSPYDRETVLTTFAAVACGDSDLTAEIALARSPSNKCQDEAAFKKDIGEIFSMLAPNYKDPIQWARTGFRMGDIQIGDVMMATLDRMKRHHVSIDGHFASLMTALVVGEAMGKKMNPEYNMFSAAAPYLMTALDGSDLRMLVSKLRDVYGQTAVVNTF